MVSRTRRCLPLFCTALSLTLLAGCGDKKDGKGPAADKAKAAAVVIAVDAIDKEFKDNKDEADKKYKDKIIEVDALVYGDPQDKGVGGILVFLKDPNTKSKTLCRQLSAITLRHP